MLMRNIIAEVGFAFGLPSVPSCLPLYIKLRREISGRH